MRTAKTLPLIFTPSTSVAAAFFLWSVLARAAELRGRVVDEPERRADFLARHSGMDKSIGSYGAIQLVSKSRFTTRALMPECQSSLALCNRQHLAL
jgi:hypothetical protein